MGQAETPRGAGLLANANARHASRHAAAVRWGMCHDVRSAEALPRRTSSSYRPWRLGREPPARRRAGQGDTPRGAGLLAHANARPASRAMGDVSCAFGGSPAEAYGIFVPPVAAWSGATGPQTRGAGRYATRRWIARQCEGTPRRPCDGGCVMRVRLSPKTESTYPTTDQSDRLFSFDLRTKKVISSQSIVIIDARTAQDHILTPRGSRDLISRSSHFFHSG